MGEAAEFERVRIDALAARVASLLGLCAADVAVLVETCINTCTVADDDARDDGGPESDFSICACGTDCNDCGPRTVDGAS